jgi:hypothetical protein
MKALLLASCIIFSFSTFATAPVCDERMTVVPCELDKETTAMAIFEMMISNKEGVRKVQEAGEYGLMMGYNQEKPGTVTIIEFSRPWPITEIKTVSKYELELMDCRGTDACGGSYKWEIIETNIGDGYTYQTTYENKLTKVQL